MPAPDIVSIAPLAGIVKPGTLSGAASRTTASRRSSAAVP
jgi:hypothetical protein